MNYVGIDIGSTASKVVVRGEKEQQFVMPTGWSGRETAGVIQARLREEGIDVGAADTVTAATGSGRISVDFAGACWPEMNVRWLMWADRIQK